MKRHFSLFLVAIVSTVVSLFFANFFIFALEGGGNSGNISVVATVSPVRIIIVDKNLTIIKIISNTKEDVRPQVYLDEEDGNEIGYSDSIIDQYNGLKKFINFSRPGIVYSREERPIQAMIKNGFGFFGKLLAF